MRRTAAWTLVAWILLVGAAAGAEIPCVFTGVEKVVAVGDLHGDYDGFVAILRGTGVVNEELRWAAGTTHLVQTGDIMDRWHNARRIFDLLKRLEKEAEASGGRVHVLIGNHEMMNISGIAFDYPEYVTVEQFLSFLPEDYVKEKENEFIRRRRVVARAGGDRSVISAEERRALWAEVLHNDQGARRRYLKHFRESYGEWITGLNTVIRIDSTVFVHGGISSEYSLKPLVETNDLVRRELRMVMRNGNFQPRLLYARDGPLWYRELAQQDEALSQDELDGILANLKARHIVIGHSVLGMPTTESMKRFDGKVWVIDTGISAYYGGRLSALIIEGNRFHIWEGER